MKTLSLWTQEKNAINAKLLQEVVTEQVVFYDKARILATWPNGIYDTSRINFHTGDPAIEHRAIFG